MYQLLCLPRSLSAVEILTTAPSFMVTIFVLISSFIARRIGQKTDCDHRVSDCIDLWCPPPLLTKLQYRLRFARAPD